MIFIIFTTLKEAELSEGEKEELKALVKNLVILLQDAINKPNFWKGRPSEIRKLQGIIEDEISFVSIEKVANQFAKLSVEIMNLAKRRNDELLS